MKEIFRQLFTIWRSRNPLQKGISLLILLCVTIALSILLFKTSSSHYTPLYPGRSLSQSEMNDIRGYFEQSSIPFQEDKEKGFLVLSEHADQIRYDLAETGTLKHEAGKGFELFDSNTWIKGEKELQVLEMRALKGQLEKDLSAFEHIKSASVNLDIPPQKTFSSSKYQTKASVILTLMPKVRLSSSELRAIVHHLTGAVRGLEPNMIAISDTSGKLYKAINPTGKQEAFHDAALRVEEQLEEKITELLDCIVGQKHFYVRVHATLNQESKDLNSLSVAVVIDKNVLDEPLKAGFQNEIERQLKALCLEYGVQSNPIVDFIAFDKTTHLKAVDQEERQIAGFVWTVLFIVCAMIAIFPLLRRYKKRKNLHEEDALLKMMTKVDVHKLADSIQHEDPQTIALMLSYLEPARAEKLIAALQVDLQEEVLFHLSELEKE